jgi:fatty acid amide hydrolase 2
VNHHLTCVVDHRFDDALKEAAKIDHFIKNSEYDEEELRLRFPLLGIPFTIKDFFSVKGFILFVSFGTVGDLLSSPFNFFIFPILPGLKHTTGLHCRKDITATEDAEIVQILKKNGAIPLGVTNVPELCMWWESVNTVYGRSKNPYDTRHITGRFIFKTHIRLNITAAYLIYFELAYLIPGGSSGGEASLQGAAGSGFGIGSDIGGSIRMPAFFCGVYGHKPTIGLVTNVGQVN